MPLISVSTTRTSARSVYGGAQGAGVAPVYQLGISRFLAEEDKPGLLDVSLYGLLAAGMTQGTYVSGEAVSLPPVHGAYDRAMFMPPNTGTNASFLGTVRELLVHERLGRAGVPAGVDLAFSTPRAWLAGGKRIEVQGVPTSFGKVSYTLVRRGATIAALLGALGGIAIAQDTPPAEQPPSDAAKPEPSTVMSGVWEFSNADRDKVCRFVFRPDAVAGGCQ